jgi:large subunit ribosomal protein L23
MRPATSIVLRPVVSEKSYGLFERGVYTFVVDRDATKPEIRAAVEQLFDVRVRRVGTLVRKGKRKRNLRQATYGRRPDSKRAIVTLAEGDRIEILEG